MKNMEGETTRVDVGRSLMPEVEAAMVGSLLRLQYAENEDSPYRLSSPYRLNSPCLT